MGAPGPRPRRRPRLAGAGAILVVAGIEVIGWLAFANRSKVASCACIGSVLFQPAFFLGGIVALVGCLVIAKAGYARLGKLSWIIGERDS